MTRVIITGAGGRMGKALIACATHFRDLEIVGRIEAGDDHGLGLGHRLGHAIAPNIPRRGRRGAVDLAYVPRREHERLRRHGARGRRSCQHSESKGGAGGDKGAKQSHGVSTIPRAISTLPC